MGKASRDRRKSKSQHFQSDSGLPAITRRQVLGGVVSSTALLYGTGTKASNISWYDLRFQLSSDGTVLTIVELGMEEGGGKADTNSKSSKPSARPVSSKSWTVLLTSFGPTAWFDMARPAQEVSKSKSSERKVFVRDAAYGGREKVYLAFSFTRAEDKGAPGRWRITYETDLWRDLGGAPLKSARASFEKFIDATPLRASATAARVGQSIDQIFASRLKVSIPAPDKFDIELHPTQEWHVIGGKEFGLVALDQQIEIASIAFGWKPYTGEKQSYFSASGDVEWPPKRSKEGVRFGSAKGHHILIASSTPVTPSTASFEVRRGAWPANPQDTQTTIAFHLPEADISVMDGARLISGPVRGAEFVLAETGLSKLDERVRKVLWGNAVGGKPGDIAQASESARGASQNDPDLSAQREIASPVGRLRVGPPRPEVIAGSKTDEDSPTAPVNGADQSPAAAALAPTAAATTPGKSNDKPSPADKERAAVNRFLQTASGDKGGAREATVFVIHDAGKVATAGLRRFAVDLSLFEASAALPDTSFSRLTFDTGDLRLIYDDGKPIEGLAAGEYPRVPASSFIWVNPETKEYPAKAQFDLSRATLTCARDYDLAKVRLRFHDLLLSFGPTPTVRPAHDDCRVIYHSGGAIKDNRPILVAEFDPQHVFEEAVFRPEPPPLPDVELKTWPDGRAGNPSREAIIAELDKRNDLQGKTDFRTEIRKAKEAEEKKKTPPSSLFTDFAKAFETAASGLSGAPKDQVQYIGPFALDPDLMAFARAVQKTSGDAGIHSAIDDMLGRMSELISKGRNNDGPLKGQLLLIDGDPGLFDRTRTLFHNALRNESLLERQDPLYGVFRDFWRDAVVNARTRDGKVGKAPQQSDLNADELTDQRFDEFLSAGNRPFDIHNNLPVALNYRNEIVDAVKNAFVERVLGRDPISSLMGARLSGTSRLAFRINCQAIAGLDAEEAGLPLTSPAGPREPGAGAVRYQPIPFTFEALTDWSRHEPAVTRRALKLFEPLASGLMPPLGNLAANESDQAILRFQGLSVGPTTAARRMTEVRESLRRGPAELETAIEIPSRLILSTAQTAIWRTNRRLPKEVLGVRGPAPIPVGQQPAPLTLENGRDPAPFGHPDVIPPHRLWSVRLSVADAKPQVRVIWSPDLRLMALGGYTPGDPVRLPGHGAPRRGPYAPWFIGLEQMESETLEANDVNKRLTKELQVKGDVCPQPVPTPDKRPRLIRWLCERAGLRKAIPSENYGIFRSSLDAFDRHQLVLLSSAYGLPVIGKRQQVGADVETGGGLIENSGQFEPGESFALLDGRDDQAIYRPISLNVRELSLTALGGSFLHDTNFKPAAGADDVFGRKIFDGFSIERWQHHMVLGRDIRVQVVYKGYLFPCGHRGSMIKLTERIFLRTEGHGIKALLRQRLYLEIANPSKRYPAVGQPHGGRMWCGQEVKLLTTRTPDLIDPTLEIGSATSSPENLSGRIDLGRSNPGLAFWPRVDITPAGRFRFDLAVDSATTTLPLIFVDNIAATNKDSLAALAAYYHDVVEEPLRTMAFGGQKIRYCTEKKTGDATFRTDKILVQAHGRLGTELQGWTGKLDNYQTTGVLEGAEQPPFYPALRRASIRIDQATRLSGGKEFLVDAQYDGHYVRYGLPVTQSQQETTQQPAPNAETPPYVNERAIFLDLLSAQKLDMGPNGDRSAAVARPHMFMIAVSQEKGVLGGDETIAWRLNPTTTEESRYKVTEAFDDIGKNEALVSLVNYFNAEARAITPEPAPDRRAPASVPAQKLDPNKPDDVKLAKILEVVKSYFSGDAKLLGTITLKQLMVLLDVDISRLPVLQETIEYGTAALSTAEGAAKELSTDVRTRVLAPLRGVVERMRQEWTALDSALVKRQLDIAGATTAPLHLKSIYPEIENGLNAVKASLDDAIVTEDAVALAPKLSAVYEAGKDLAHTLAVLASNPVQRLEEAVGGEIQRRIEELRKSFDLAKLAQSLKGLVEQLKDAVPQAVANKIVDWIDSTVDGGPSADRFTFGIIPPDLAVVGKSVLETVPDPVLAQLVAIGSRLRNDAALDAKQALRDLLKDLISTLIKDGKLTDLDAVVTKNVSSLVTKFHTQLDDAVKTAKPSIDAITGLAAARLDVLKKALKFELDDFAGFIRDKLQAEIDRGIDLAAERYPAELAFAVQSAQTIGRAITRVQRAKAAVESRDPRKILAEASDLVQDIYGIDLAGEAKTKFDGVGTQINTTVAGWAAALAGPVELQTLNAAALSLEVDACQKFKAGNTAALPAKSAGAARVNSLPLTQMLGDAIEQLPDVVTKLGDIATQIDNSKAAIENAGLPFADLRNFTATALGLVNDGLLPDIRVLYCQTVDLVVSLRTIAEQLKTLSIADRDALERITRASQDVRRSLLELGTTLKRIIDRIAIFVGAPKHQQMLATGLMFGGAAALILQKAPALTQFTPLLNAARSAETTVLVPALRQIVNVALKLVRATAIGGKDGATAARSAIESALKEIGKLDISLEPEATALIGSIKGLEDQLTALEVMPEVPAVTTIDALLKFPLASSVTVQTFFASAPDDKAYLAVVDRVRALELRVMAKFRAFEQRLKGWQDALRAQVEPLILGTGVLSALAEGHSAILDARNAAVKTLDGISPLKATGRRVLLVRRVDVQVCKVDDPGEQIDTLIRCDELFREDRILDAVRGFVNGLPTPAPADTRRDDFIQLLRMWKAGNAAPIVILTRAADVVTDIMRGDILAAIDLGAFRDQIEDAIAELIPTRATLNYDFKSRISRESSGDSIFQPTRNAPFGIEVRAVADLLKGKVEFGARGYIGPFNIKLIGSIVDALTLKFGGASFELKAGAKPRFDVVYEDFVIGRDLEFAQKLQSYLSPDEGSGVFIQPLQGRPGLEAGYGINLGTLSVGATSFFNVTLNVSAELPFDSTPSFFKVSLGRRLAPFTMSALPFAGSGYFSIFAGADGVRGFEASFEFGAGGSIGFGVLTAQARIQVGVFVRVLRVENDTVTTIYGTFFAGGSASIWIFHFATSLYVRLGQSNGGAMYGEATFSFSFSLGLVDYDFSVTAFHQENAVGSQKSAELLDEAPGRPRSPIRFAAAGGTASDAPSIGAGSIAGYGSEPVTQSLAADPLEDWTKYRNYFDTSLLPECVIP